MQGTTGRDYGVVIVVWGFRIFLCFVFVFILEIRLERPASKTSIFMSSGNYFSTLTAETNEFLTF